MADEEKTEEPTPKKIEKAREDGNVPKSMEVSGVISLVIAFVLIYVLFWFVVDQIEQLYRYYTSLYTRELTRELMVDITIKTTIEVLYTLTPFGIGLVVAGIVGNVSQFGFNFTTKAVHFKPSKVDPIKGMKNLLSMKKLAEGMIVTFKVLVAFGVGFYVFFLFAQELNTVAMFPLFDQLVWFKDKVIILVGILLILFFVLATIDLVIKRYQYFKELKMSKNEVKDEHKQMEGNPEIKKKIRQNMMQASMRRMMSEVPSADVVVTNPTHYAVALRYNQQKERAPRVVAKGVDNLAIRIKEIAREHDVPIVENRSLARELYKVVEIDSQIPENLFQAVAEVLAYVHRLEQKR